MLHPRDTRGLWGRLALTGALLASATACESETDSQVSDATEYPAVVRIVEVLSTPASPAQPAFVELRNDAEITASVRGWSLRIDPSGAELILTPRAVDGSRPAAGRGDDPAALAPHALALVVDAAADPSLVAEAACEAPIATTRTSLGETHAANEDVLVSALGMQAARRCAPVFVAPGLNAELAGAHELVLFDGGNPVDRAMADFAASPAGVAYERLGGERADFALSPIGATPAARNFYRGDFDYLNDSASAVPLEALSSSPWRVGDRILELERQAGELQAQADATHNAELASQAQARRDEATAVAGGQLPPNPLSDGMASFAGSARRSLRAAFYQINAPTVIDALIDFKRSGQDVSLITDAQFIGDPHYTDGFDALSGAGIGMAFDQEDGRNRASLMHDKFLVRDNTWVWTGSFNPIEDEPERIHADNALVMQSRAAASLHAQEFETMFAGSFSTRKRGQGVAGGRFAVDGAPVTVRFSPGMTASQLKRRAVELQASGSPERACDVRLSNNTNALPERYRRLSPCGGPYDLIVGEAARATSSIYFVAFSISLSDLGDVMVERMTHDGVDVRGVVDPTVSTKGLAKQLIDVGADIRYTPNSDPGCPGYVHPRSACPRNPNKVWLHHKFVLIDYGTDHPVLITGSHNLSNNAENQNDETLLVVRDRAIVERYYRFFREAYDHPQTMGPQRVTDGLPALAITEVVGAASPQGEQYVEIANFGTEMATLDGLELWNRHGTVLPLSTDLVLTPGERAVLVVGDGSQIQIREGTEVVHFNADPLRPIVGLRTALVLRSADDGRWVATYDPYTAEQTLPEGVEPARAGSAVSWNGFDGGTLEAELVKLLGVNTTPWAAEPTWEPRGFFSDWLDEHHVTRTSLILMHAPRDRWSTEGGATPGW